MFEVIALSYLLAGLLTWKMLDSSMMKGGWTKLTIALCLILWPLWIGLVGVGFWRQLTKKRKAA